MSIDVEVPLSNDLQINHAVASYLVQHMLKKRHASIELSLAGSVEAELDTDTGLQGGALNTGAARRRYRSHDLCSWEINAFWANAPWARYNGPHCI